MSKVKKIKQPKEELEEEEEVVEEYDIDSDIDESIYDEDLEEDIEEINNDIDNSDQNECIMERIIEDNYNTLIDSNHTTYLDDNNKKENVQILLEKNDRISPNRLTKYEMVRILGERTKQLTLGAKPLIKNYQSLSYEQIAEEELKLNMTPYKIKRILPNKKYEIWSLDELKKDHLLSYLY